MDLRHLAAIGLAKVPRITAVIQQVPSPLMDGTVGSARIHSIDVLYLTEKINQEMGKGSQETRIKAKKKMERERETVTKGRK